MAIVFQDDFTGATIDAGKWTETDPNSRISQSNTLSIANPHSDNRAIFVDNLTSVSSIGSGVAVLQANLTWTTDSAQEAQGGVMLYKDANNYAWICSRTATSGVFRLQIVSSGSSVYSFTTAITKAKDVKIWTDGTDIKFYYYNAGWTQMGSTQTYSLGYSLYAVLTAVDGTTYTGANPVIIDDLYFSNADYATQYPTAGSTFKPKIIMF